MAMYKPNDATIAFGRKHAPITAGQLADAHAEALERMRKVSATDPSAVCWTDAVDAVGDLHRARKSLDERSLNLATCAVAMGIPLTRVAAHLGVSRLTLREHLLTTPVKVLVGRGEGA